MIFYFNIIALRKLTAKSTKKYIYIYAIRKNEKHVYNSDRNVK